MSAISVESTAQLKSLDGSQFESYVSKKGKNLRANLLKKKILPKSNRYLDVVKELGCPIDGKKDASRIINLAIRKAKGRTIYLRPGYYLLNSSIRPINDTKLVLSMQSYMIRNFDGRNGTKNGALIQGSVQRNSNRVSIRGGRWSTPGNRFSGRVVSIIGNNWLIDSMIVDSWGGPRIGSICFSVIGSNIQISDCYAVGTPRRTGLAGVRIEGGKGIKVSNCYIESGDDTFCAFPTEKQKNYGAGLPIENVQFINCSGLSTNARFLGCGLTSTNARRRGTSQNELNAVVINNIVFFNCVGLSKSQKPFGPAFFVSLISPSRNASVSNISFVNCHGRVRYSALECARISASQGTRISNISFKFCTIIGGRRRALTISKFAPEVKTTQCVLRKRNNAES